ncbi:hypothetical protein GF389_00460 [Candidatus Dojkabacteria bacterium]|nr:hypothetical protein [Candidatus Dojkabacteria bacterium]
MNKQIKEIRKKAVPILRKYPIRRAGLFGSVTRGEATLDSDIDMLVELEDTPKLSFFEYLDIESDLENELGKKVDLVRYDKVRPELREYILPHEVSIYEKNS